MSTSEQYHIIEKIGEGGMGIVYLAEDVLIRRRVAIKSLHNQQLLSGEQSERFQQEALALARLNHSNITHLYTFFPKDNSYWMVMEYVDGKTLENWIYTRGIINTAAACSITLQILNGLEHAHQKGIIHRDLKPSNIMISYEGEVKIMDFGIARIQNSQRLTQQGKSVGTLEYMAPEQIQGREGDELTDVYATGNMLYEMLGGVPPFRNETDYHLMKDKLEQKVKLNSLIMSNASPALQQVILKALETNPAKRYPTVQAFREALLKAAPGLLRGDRLQESLQKSEQVVLDSEADHRKPIPANPGFLKQVNLLPASLSTLFQPVKKLDRSVKLLIAVSIICGGLLTWNSLRSSKPVQDSSKTGYSVNLESMPEENATRNAGIIETQLIQNNTPGLPPPASSTEKKNDTIKSQPEKPATVKKPDKKAPPKDAGTDRKEPEKEPAEETIVKEKEEPAVKNTANRKAVQIPAGTFISLVLEETITSENKQKDGNLIRLTAAADVVVNGQVIVTKGAEAVGKIVDVEPSARRRKGLIGFVIVKVKGRDGKDIRVQSERFRLRSANDNEAAVYSAGKQFSGTLRKGTVVN
ncbi:MAG: serine/threonine protein kinase [Chitinophagaceae bacterium]|nr:serine/threonine protein kinase [Chitinophagaceae bacterium]MCW5929152.1 serine/threonine protein kinase [Chitinophagaceae bacterium]